MRNRKGMTLVEVIVAMALFAIVMVTVFPAFLITNMMNNVSKEFMDANYYASAELEEIYNKSKTTSMPITVVWMSTRGYACATQDTGERVCTKTVDDVDYEVVFDYYPDLGNLVIVEITVEFTAGEYAGDRAEIENYMRFNEGS